MLTLLFFVLGFFTNIFLALTKRPIFGLYAYIMSVYMYAPGSWWGSSLPDLRWAMLSSLVTLISINIHSKKDGAISNILWLKSGEVKFYLAFVVWVWLQNMWALSSHYSMAHSILVTKFLLLIYLIKKSTVNINDYIGIIIANILGCGFWGYLGWTRTGGGRFESVPTPGMSDGNLLSIYMAPFLIMASFVLLAKISNRKYLIIPLVGLTLNAIFLTQSRGAMVGLAVSGLLALFFIPKYTKKLFYVYLVIALTAGAALLGQDFVERMQNTVEDKESGEVEASAASRIFIAKAQLAMASENPIFGYGHRGTLQLSPQYMDDSLLTGKGGSRVRGSHNLTMTVLVDHGLIGIVFYYGGMMLILFKALSYRKEILTSEDPIYIILVGSILGLVCMIVTSQFANSMKLEIDIWCIAMCSVLLSWLEEKKMIAEKKMKAEKRARKIERTKRIRA